MSPADELVALGEFYGVPVGDVIDAHGPALERYAEWVLGRDDFALVTLGETSELCALAGEPAASRLRHAAARWPAAITGIKLEPSGRRAPTLYIRTSCPWADGMDWLAREVGSVAHRVPAARTLYGLGFQGDVVKTYALTPDGFVSFRIDSDELMREHKDYRADVAWDAVDWPDERWTAIGALGRSLGFRTAGHVGRMSDGEHVKIYVERRGAIPTDRSLA